jgi:CRISPR-associated protein Cas2
MKGTREVIVCYDMESNKSRKKLFDGLKDLGLVPIQKSVFWGRLLPAEEKAVLHLMRKWMDAKAEDRGFIVPASVSKAIEDRSIGYSPTVTSGFKEKYYHVL